MSKLFSVGVIGPSSNLLVEDLVIIDNFCTHLGIIEHSCTQINTDQT